MCKLTSIKFIVTSSGAAYGYYADNAEWLKEEDPIRGNQEFPYKLVQESNRRKC
ncbi:MAG: hypothetical protein R2728_13575 [Chitinophagales bacterium]